MTFDRAEMTVAAPTIQKDLEPSVAEMSMILTVYFWSYAIGQVPTGHMAKRIGSRKVLFGTSTFWSFMTIAMPFGRHWAE